MMPKCFTCDGTAEAGEDKPQQSVFYETRFPRLRTNAAATLASSGWWPPGTGCLSAKLTSADGTPIRDCDKELQGSNDAKRGSANPPAPTVRSRRPPACRWSPPTVRP